MKYILASASLRRQELLHRILNEFEIVIGDFDEDGVVYQGNIEEYVKELALGKANSVKVEEDSIIIAGDTIVTLDNKILGKPKNENDAFNMLKALSGRTHRVYSGIVVHNTKTNKVEKEALYTEVTFSKLTDEEIRAYIDTKEPMDKAGAYGIQGLGGVFVEKINGCYYNVVGLPLNLLNKMLIKIK